MKAQIQEDIKTAMRERNQQAINTVRGLMSEIKRVEIDTRTELTDQQIVGIVQKEIKKRRDAIDFAQKGSRPELIAENEQEIKLLQRYLGDQLSEVQLRELIGNIIAGGASDVGKVMAALNKDHKGKFEGKVASQLAQEMLRA